MPARIQLDPAVTARGTVNIWTEVQPEVRNGLIAIATRRGERLKDVVNKALEQYVAADARRK